MNVSAAIEELEAMGFEFGLSHGYPNEEIRYSFNGPGSPDPVRAKPLLVAVKESRDEAVEVLRIRKAHMAWIEVWDQWSKDKNPGNDAVHTKRLATAAIIGELPFYEDGEHDAGPDAWRRWAAQFDKSEIPSKEVMPMRARVPRPLPWDI